jgi:signal transduction histidine kinase
MTPGLRNIRLDDLLGHLCGSTGLYSRETFLSLYGCITRMIRDHRLTGFVMTRTLDDPAFETAAHAMETLPGLPLYRFNQPDLFPVEAGFEDRTGFLIVLTDRLCATLFWSAATHSTYRMYEGGWTFHPGDTRTIAAQLIARLERPELEHLLQETAIDRRYDDKLNVLTTALVQGLENRNRELTVALEQVKVLNKKKLDTERLAAIGQLSSVIAHEIRNPLGLIDLYAKLTEDQLAKLLDDPLFKGEANAVTERKDVLLKNLALIRQATGSLETILSELTNYSRPLQLHLQATDMHRLVGDVCDFYRPSYQEKGMTLTFAEDASALSERLAVDADKIRQALINLLKNALEASPEGGAVSVRLACRTNDAQLYIKVADEGCGVAPAHLKKLFTPYFSTKGSGTGLGLAHSRKILQAHGGSVELLSSMPGQGSVFALILPRNTADSATFEQDSE